MRADRSARSLPVWLTMAGAGLLSLAAGAAPYRPADPAEVLLVVTGPGARQEIAALQSLAVFQTHDERAPIELARKFIGEAKDRSEPRILGYAQTVLRPLLARSPPSLEALRAWADILQYRHDFRGSRAVLDSVLARDARDADAVAMRAEISMVQGDWPAARGDCARLAALQLTTQAAVCLAQTRAASGDLAHAYRVMTEIANREGAAGPLAGWIAGITAELADRSGDSDAAARWYEFAASADPSSQFAKVAWSGHLLRTQRYRETLAVLEGAPASDGVLLNVALAKRALHDPGADDIVRTLIARMAQARARGDESHLRERARFELEWQHDATASLASAERNWQSQRELADLRLLAAAARAAEDVAALGRLASWLMAQHFEDRVTAGLVAAGT